ncbi:MAG: hypothetical protein BZ151_09405 [Desulfobacca sp. 4484_104]|nr:MAG: hypothetical protein BZ151_09405 [Desulfobacca sp. 4484_104]
MKNHFNQRFLLLSLLFLGMFFCSLSYGIATMKKYRTFTGVEHDYLAGVKLQKQRKDKAAAVFWKRGIRKFLSAAPQKGYYPSIYEGFRYAGNCYHKLGMDKEALKAYDQALRYHPFSITDLASRAEAALQTNNKALAIQSLELCQQIYPFSWKISYSLADTYMKTGQPRRALSLYLKAWKQRPRDFRLFLSVVNTYTILGNIEEASRLTDQMAARKLRSKDRKTIISIQKYLARLKAAHGKKK